MNTPPTTVHPLSLTHAIFNFVDSSNAPLAQLTAEFEVSTGEKVEATSDDFGEVYLAATRGQTYTLGQVQRNVEDLVLADVAVHFAVHAELGRDFHEARANLHRVGKEQA